MQEEQQGVFNSSQELEQVSLSCLHYLVPDHNDPNSGNNLFGDLNTLMNTSFSSPTQSSQDNNTDSFYNNVELSSPTSAVMKERKQRRMISNRESARRSRMRKQRHLDELWSHVVWLRGENHRLVDRLARASDTHDQVLLENSRLRQEAAELRRRVSSATSLA